MSSLEEKNIHGNQVEPNGQSDDLCCAYYIRSFENRRQHLLSDGTNHFVVSGFEKLPPFAFSPLLVRPGHVKSQVSLGPGPTTICLTSVDSLITEREKVNSRLKDFPKLSHLQKTRVESFFNHLPTNHSHRPSLTAFVAAISVQWLVTVLTLVFSSKAPLRDMLPFF